MTAMRVLVPVDLSPESEALVRYASELTAAASGELIALHLYRQEDAIAALREAGLFLDLYIGRLRSELDYLLTAAGAGRRNVRVEVVEGDPVEVIVSRAARLGVDLIVMGTHRRTGLSRLLVGSVAEGVLRRAPCPVILVPERVLAGRPPAVAAAGGAAVAAL